MTIGLTWVVVDDRAFKGLSLKIAHNRRISDTSG
jgi:hypothetical protein